MEITGPTLSAYSAVFSATDLGRWYFNSAIVTIFVTVLTVITTSMAGYALSRGKFRGKGLLFALILAGIMIPPQALIVPLFRELQTVHLINTYWALILPQVPAPISVFIFKKVFDGVPIEIEQAATVDSAGWWTAYARIALPLVQPDDRRRLDLHVRLDMEQLPVAVPGGHQPDHDDHPGRHRHRGQRGRSGECPADGIGRARGAPPRPGVPVRTAPDRRRGGGDRAQVAKRQAA